MGVLGCYGKVWAFCRRDSLSGVRGVLDRLMTHFLVQLSVLHVSLELEGGCLGTVVGAVGAEAALVLFLVSIKCKGSKTPPYTHKLPLFT